MKFDYIYVFTLAMTRSDIITVYPFHSLLCHVDEHVAEIDHQGIDGRRALFLRVSVQEDIYKFHDSHHIFRHCVVAPNYCTK